MEFLVEFEVNVPDGVSSAEVEERNTGEALAAARLAREGHLVRLWNAPGTRGESVPIGVYRAGSRDELDGLFTALPLKDWMRIKVTRLAPHPNDPEIVADGSGLPFPRLTLVYRLEATLGEPLDIGETVAGHRRIVPLTGGTFVGPELNGALVAGASADWQTVHPDGSTTADVRCTLQTTAGELLYVQSRGVRHGSADILERLARGETVDPREYTFRTATQIQAAASRLDWLNKGVFVAVGGREPAGVIYDTYLVH